MLFFALIIGRMCGSIAESKCKSKKFWFWLSFISSFALIFGWHQKREYEKLKSKGISWKDVRDLLLQSLRK
jgi:hypothetical protein